MTTAPRWQPVTVSLAYRLGEITLFSKRFSGCANCEHFTRVAPYKVYPDPANGPDPSADLVFYPAYPVAFEPAPMLSSGSWLIYTPYTFRNSYVDFKRLANFDAYLQTFSSKSRSTLQRKVRKFAEADGGNVDWREFTRPEDMEQFMSLAGAVSVKTYQEKLLHSGLPRTPEFIAKAKVRATSGGVYGYILFLQKKPVAYVFCFCTDGIVTYDYVGYDPTFASLSAGTVLQYFILQSLFVGKRAEVFDFTEGEGQHKLLFATDERRCAKTYFFRRRPMTVLLVNLHYRMNTAVEGVGRLLEKFGLKAWVRRLIRRSA